MSDRTVERLCGTCLYEVRNVDDEPCCVCVHAGGYPGWKPKETMLAAGPWQPADTVPKDGTPFLASVSVHALGVSPCGLRVLRFRDDGVLLCGYCEEHEVTLNRLLAWAPLNPPDEDEGRKLVPMTEKECEAAIARVDVELESRVTCEEAEKDCVVGKIDVKTTVIAEEADPDPDPGPRVRCLREGCGHVGIADEFPWATSAYSDLRCPKCGTTDLDTSELAKALPGYGYGDNNSLQMPLSAPAPASVPAPAPSRFLGDDDSDESFEGPGGDDDDGEYSDEDDDGFNDDPPMG